MYFAIRDDDLNFFSKPNQFIDVYDDLWNICPISCSTVPFHACTVSEAIPEKYWTGDRIYPIGNNTELVDFLLDAIANNYIHITLHGYNHRDESTGFEFKAGFDLKRKVNEGRCYLESIFKQKINVFVPPHNTIARAGLNAVIAERMDLGIIAPFSSRSLNLSNLLCVLKKKIISLRCKDKFYPYILRFPDHNEVYCHSLVPGTDISEMILRLHHCHNLNGVFLLGTHYWEYSKPAKRYPRRTMRDLFFMFWEEVVKLSNVKFCTLTELMRKE